MFGHFIRQRPVAPTLDVLTCSITVSDAGSGDPCSTSDLLDHAIAWTVSGTGTVRIDRKVGAGTFATIATGIAHSASPYIHQNAGYVSDAGGVLTTFTYRVINEADASDFAEGARSTRVAICA